MPKQKTMTVHIAPDGTVSGLHYDDLSLGDTGLGPMKLSRASEIHFDEATQSFFVELPSFRGGHHLPKFLTGFSGYDVARSFEVFLLETCAISQVNPSYDGSFYRMATECRTRFDNGDREISRWNGNSIQGSCPV